MKENKSVTYTSLHEKLLILCSITKNDDSDKKSS